MGAWIDRPVASREALGSSDLLARGGAVVSFVFVAAAWIYAGPVSDGPAWRSPATTAVVVVLVACLAAMLRTDAWPVRLVTVLALITLSELLTGVTFRQDSDSLLLAHSVLLATSSVLVLALRNTWRSVLFTAFLGLLVFGHTYAVSVIHRLGPTTALTVLGAWFVMLVIRHSAPKAVAIHCDDQAIRQESATAQAQARDAADAAMAQARLLHDTTLRTLTVLARGGAGADPDELRALLASATHDAGGPVTGPTPPNAAVAPAVRGDGGPRTQAGMAVVEPSGVPELAEVLRDRAARQSGKLFTVEVYGEAGALPENLQSALVDAAEECMVNAARHAGTDHVDVLVSRSGSAVSVLISDAGSGFNADAVPAEHFGLRQSVVQRMNDVGGHARVLSAAGRGTTVVLDVDAP
ncbi:hypothetical protein NEK97_05395 [Paenarthrobacter sp. UW852]|uniref:sensor histidine kinase n=1 Tax=Paenarthrobacter sp. UW852 TaxID=2951989 RepID=UPI0021489676|nr:ATP-binding protein [Paenarthrobacter sp. UW852]MCR1160890.1 hypothetical protein [Paenarthrobacter sp. UW852]